MVSTLTVDLIVALLVVVLVVLVIAFRSMRKKQKAKLRKDVPEEEPAGGYAAYANQTGKYAAQPPRRQNIPAQEAVCSWVDCKDAPVIVFIERPWCRSHFDALAYMTDAVVKRSIEATGVWKARAFDPDELQQPEFVEPEPVEEVAVMPQARAGVFCVNCGTQIPAGAAFCAACGFRVGAALQSQPQTARDGFTSRKPAGQKRTAVPPAAKPLSAPRALQGSNGGRIAMQSQPQNPPIRTQTPPNQGRRLRIQPQAPPAEVEETAPEAEEAPEEEAVDVPSDESYQDPDQQPNQRRNIPDPV
jgi:zinc-ribbon domain